MALADMIKNLDITKVKAPSGLTYGEELVKAANLLRECIQSRINRGTMNNCIKVADLADIRTDGRSLAVTLKIQNALRPSIFKAYNNKDANVFWLLNDGYTVKKDVYFKDIANFGYRIAERFVEEGIADFNAKNRLGIKVTVKRPLLYYG